ncbi:hypothetical protein NP439_17420 [Oceanobacillus jeddahense]|uniref:Uncharacterized protein n=1 Tax=Oceanobacillus jeddahense TaxID=1462527 RepID=A0ABY5JNX4_9BACI|nr:hypothetical protein [Oceanobacillus jeddahense]UUI01816.1 hypothetical protein NP439_17420 [Oceanobacillus jeddahense]
MKRWYVVIALIVVLAGCGNRGEEVIEPTAPDENNETTSTVMFQEIDITTDGEQFHIVGQVRTDGDAFFYRVEQDGEPIQEEKTIELEEAAPGSFQDFEIMETFSEDILEQEEPPIVIMYGKDADKNEINPNYVPVDTEE